MSSYLVDLNALQVLQNELVPFGVGLSELWQFGAPLSATFHTSSWDQSRYYDEPIPFGFGQHQHIDGQHGEYDVLHIETTLGMVSLTALQLGTNSYGHYDWDGGLETWNESASTQTFHMLEFHANATPPTPVFDFNKVADPVTVGGMQGDASNGVPCLRGDMPTLSPACIDRALSLITSDSTYTQSQSGGWAVHDVQAPGAPVVAGGNWSTFDLDHYHNTVGATAQALIELSEHDGLHVNSSSYDGPGGHFAQTYASSFKVADGHLDFNHGGLIPLG